MPDVKDSAAAAYLIPTPSGPGLKAVALKAGETTIGRNPENTVHIARGAVSRFHAKIVFEEGDYVLIDLNSRNGTFVDDQRVSKARLNEGAVVTFGNRSFIFSLRGPEPAAPTVRTSPPVAPSQTVRVLDSASLAGSEVLAREAATATRAFLEPGSEGQEITVQEALLAHKRLSLLYRLSEDLRALKDPDEMLAKGIDLLFTALPASRAVALLRSGPAQDAPMESRLVRRRSGVPDEEIPVSRTVLDRVIKQRMAVVCRDALDDSRFRKSDSIRMHSLRSIVCVPMLAGERVVGAVHLDTSESLEAFGQNDLDFAASVANELAISIENQRLQQEAARNERMAAIGLTITNVAHNIKNILLMNKGAEELMDLSLERVGDEKVRKNWRMVRQCLSRINGLAADMLSFARVQPFEVRTVDVNVVVKNYQNQLCEGLAREGVELVLDLQDNLPSCSIDEAGLQRALLNLVVNASDAISRPEGGRVTIATRLDDQDCVRISVADNGCGIPDQDMNKIFQLFYTTKNTRGTGLGLPMVQRFVESMNGRIAVESRVGVGSVFTLILPRAHP